MKKTISVISPCFNEEANIMRCIETVRGIFEQQLPDYELEHIFCDNASSDRTVDLIKSEAASDKRIKLIVNSRNFGILNNTYNGVLNASGDAVLLFLPVDLQDPPELIAEFVKQWEAGNEIVYGLRAKREEGAFIRTIRKLYYRLLSSLTYVDYPPDAGDFQLVDRRVVEAMKQTEDARPFMRLMTFDSGFKSKGVKYTWRARKAGKSKNRWTHMFDQGLIGIIGFSNAPVRLALYSGIIISFLSILYALLVLLLAAFGMINAPQGTATIIIALFFFGGVQLFFLGVIGEYLMAVYNQVRKRPLVIERERVNFPPAEPNEEEKRPA